MNKGSVYNGSEFVMATLHKKAQKVAPIFLHKLGASVVECVADTDVLGTFSGEIDRKNNFLDSARIKCELGLNKTNAYYGLASEGSFGHHRYIPFFTVNTEILYFIDKLRGFHLHMMHVSEKNNYAWSIVRSFLEIENFARKALFPSHGLIVRPHVWDDKNIIFKGIQSKHILEEAFNVSLKYSVDCAVWVETDMRAHMNPSRMLVIQELAEKMAQRLSTVCPQCTTPGWGICRTGKKIKCSWCGEDTQLIKSDFLGCVTCTYEEEVDRFNKFIGDLSEHCINCNP